MRTDIPHTIRLADYRPSAYGVSTVTLMVRLEPHACHIAATIACHRNAGTIAGEPLKLHGDDIRLVSARLNGQPLADADFSASPGGFTLHCPPAEPFTLTFETVVDAEANTQCNGLYRSSGVWTTQCEAEGFRRITYFLDRPDVMAVYTVRVEADRDEAPVLLANGNPVEQGVLSGTNRHYAVWHDPHPKPSYLFALVGGRLGSVHDRFTTRSGRDVRLGIYVEEGKQDRCGYAMDALKRAMTWDEETFGCEYDLDVFNIVAVSDFNMGAMENKGLNIFNDKYVLALPDTATDLDYDNIERIIAHEYFHNWTGNRITCRDWFQLCLKEGLTVFRDQEFSSDMRSRKVKRIEDVVTLRARQFPEDAGPLAHPVRPTHYQEINNFYTATVYEKGAEVIRMLKSVIGADAFANGMRLYLSRHDGEACTIEQFLACFAEAAGRDLGQFALWYSQAGTPDVHVSLVHEPSQGLVHLNIRQKLHKTPGQSHKAAQVIPFAIGLIGRDGAERPLMDADGKRMDNRLVLDRLEQTFTFSGHTDAPILSLNRGFSAPVNVMAPLSMADKAVLARHDSDPFNRWEAVQSMALAYLAGEARAPMSQDCGPLVEIVSALLAEADADPAFSAHCLSLPSDLDVARELKNDIDPAAIRAAGSRLETAIAKALKRPLLEKAQAIAVPQPFTPDAHSAGLRMLRNRLYHLAAGDSDLAVLDIVQKHGLGADNMTDRHAAMLIAARHARPHRETLFDAFRQRHAGDAIALDKWFAAQCAIPEVSALGRARMLMKAPEFQLSNPNRARAVIGTFAMNNPVAFARPDGQGFMAVAEWLVELDRLNAQTAARILNAFRDWKSYEAGRRAHARAALDFIASHDLSPNCRELVELTRA